MAKSPLDRLSLRWKFPDGREDTVSFVDWTERLLGQLHETLADPATDAAQRRRVKKQIRETKERLELMGALSNAVQSVTEKDTAAKVAQVNRDNASKPRPKRRKVDHEEVKPEYLKLIQSGMTQDEATAWVREKYSNDLGKTALSELIKKIIAT